MRIVHLSTHDVWGGAAIAAHRLQAGLRALGEDSTMFVCERHGAGQDVLRFAPPLDFKSRLARTLRRKLLARELSHYAQSLPDDGELFSDDRSQHSQAPLDQIPPCDVLHLHLISEFLDCQALFGWIPRQMPVVWTLHDLNPFTGGCHFDSGCKKYRGSCGACPKLGSSRDNDLSRQVWRRKRNIFDQISAEQLQLVAPCSWVAEEVRQSSLLGNFPVTQIPYGVDVEAFAPRDRVFARDALGIPREARVLVFAALNVTERRKGFSLLVEALAGLREEPNLFLLVVGGHSAVQQIGIPCRTLGYVSSDRLLSIVFSAADLCVVPTLQETGPLIVIESMACGTPVVGFPSGDMPEMVRAGITGQLVPSGDSTALREGIKVMLGHSEKLTEMRISCRRVAVEDYSVEIMAKRHIRLYKAMLERNLAPGPINIENLQADFIKGVAR